MTIQSVSSTTTSSYNSPQQHKLPPILTANMERSELLTPEQKNTLQDDIDTRLAEQIDSIKSTYQTAKDLDLTHAYYQQQQKLFDIYMQSGSSDAINTNNDSPSTVQTLTDAYASLYNLHRQMKGITQQSPFLSGGSLAPKFPVEGLPIENKLPLARIQTDTYNNLMMPTTKSYLHLNA